MSPTIFLEKENTDTTEPVLSVFSVLSSSLQTLSPAVVAVTLTTRGPLLYKVLGKRVFRLSLLTLRSRLESSWCPVVSSSLRFTALSLLDVTRASKAASICSPKLMLLPPVSLSTGREHESRLVPLAVLPAHHGLDLPIWLHPSYVHFPFSHISRLDGGGHDFSIGLESILIC